MRNKYIKNILILLSFLAGTKLLANNVCQDSGRDLAAPAGSDLGILQTYQSLSEYAQMDPVLKEIFEDAVKFQGFEVQFSTRYRTSAGLVKNLCSKVGRTLSFKKAQTLLIGHAKSETEEVLIVTEEEFDEKDVSESSSCTAKKRKRLCEILSEYQSEIAKIIKDQGDNLTLNSLKDLVVPYYKRLTRENEEAIQILRGCKATVALEIDGPEMSYERDFSK